MKSLLRTLFPIAALGLAITVSGCCVTSISSRKVAAPCQTCQPVYDSIPQGIGPMDPPSEVPAPTPFVPPTPSTTQRNFGARTTQAFREMGDSIRDTFRR